MMDANMLINDLQGLDFFTPMPKACLEIHLRDWQGSVVRAVIGLKAEEEVRLLRRTIAVLSDRLAEIAPVPDKLAEGIAAVGGSHEHKE